MHPNSQFRPGLPPAEERALLESLIEEIGFGMIFATTLDGPRVAHVPMVSTGDGALHFHLSRGNALTRHIDGMTALAVVNGPDSYVSPRWYADREQVPTWNYIALELEGRVRRMDADGLHGLLETLSERQEVRVEGGDRWSIEEMPESALRAKMAGIVGFEMEVMAWRPTFKLSQNKPAEERERVIAALEAQGSLALAQLMRTLAP